MSYGDLSRSVVPFFGDYVSDYFKEEMYFR
jgi:hypothetical protein